MAKTITWKDIEDRTCVLTINDGSVATTELTPGDNPFVTQIDDGDDLFTPIRTSSGNIGIGVDSVDDIVSMVGRTPLTTPVELTVNDNIRWVGFLSCESFSQEWDRGPLDIALPVMSGLEVLRGIHYPYTQLSDLGYINIAQFICNLNHALGNIYTAFIFPNISNPATTLLYKFRMSNYATSDDKNTTYEMATYYDILEDICKLFGWQAVEYHTYLVFMAADVKSIDQSHGNHISWTRTQFERFAAGQSSTSASMDFDTVVPEFFGVNHRRSFVAGKNKVEVTGELNEIPEDIWSMDVVEQCVYKGYDYKNISWGSWTIQTYDIKKFAAYQSPGASSPNGNLQAFNSMVQMACDTQYGYNIKFEAYKNGVNAYGGCVAYEKFNLTGRAEGDQNFIMRLITKGLTDDSTFFPGVVIHTNFYYTPNQNTTDRFLIKGSVLTANSAADVFEKPSGDFYCRALLHIGGYYYNGNAWTTTPQSLVLVVEDGEIQGYGMVESGDIKAYHYIPAPNNASGEVIMEVISTCLPASSYGPGNEYVAYENLKVQLVTANNRRSGVYIEDKSIRGDINEDKADLNNGFTNDWSQTCGLTLAREAVPGSNGVVLKSDLTLPNSLYDNKYPEKALCDRVAAYAAKARMVLYAVVKSEGAMLSPLKRYAMQSGGRTWICLCQTVNWQNNEIMAGFFEPSYEYVL